MAPTQPKHTPIDPLRRPHSRKPGFSALPDPPVERTSGWHSAGEFSHSL